MTTNHCYAITDWNNISNNECNIAGNILGRMHAINPPKNVSHRKPELSKINWHEYIRKANEEKSVIAPLLVDIEKEIKDALDFSLISD